MLLVIMKDNVLIESNIRILIRKNFCFCLPKNLSIDHNSVFSKRSRLDNQVCHYLKKIIRESKYEW